VVQVLYLVHFAHFFSVYVVTPLVGLCYSCFVMESIIPLSLPSLRKTSCRSKPFKFVYNIDLYDHFIRALMSVMG
jgi:hypothetical protein